MTRGAGQRAVFGMASLAASFTGEGIAAVDEPVRRATPPREPAMTRIAPVEPAAGFTAGRRNWGVIAGIGAAHAALLALLLTTGAIQVGKAPPPVAIAFVQEIAEPIEPTVAPEAALEPVPTDVFVPDVIVETSVAPAPTVTATDVPPPPKAVAAPTTVKGSGDAVVVPPDFSADQLNNAGPRYPSASRRAHEEGTVMLKVLVSPDGRAQDLMVATSSGFARLDDAALATVKRWAFLPAKQAGRPVSAWVLVPVTFELGDSPRGRGRGRGDGGHRDLGAPASEPVPTST